ECLELVERLVAGGDVTEREACRLLPRREQFVSLWRAIEHMEREELCEGGRLPMLRSLAAALDGTESFLRTALGVEVFAERGLITVVIEGERMSLRPQAGRRADLEESVHIEALRRALGKKDGKRGL
ncbi:MAG: single-stranded-DNA-specific exonuclease RecJ, partial [Oscillospiraceae bacterium]|nr:single-stranded-DNA-specific exonuclease RecJ [Oscillospiraceae bacterium]